MAGAVCPSCGVAVLPGYTRCPKCRKMLPRSRAQSTVVEGGTAVESTSKGPMYAIIAVAIAGVALIAYLGLRGGDKPTTPAANPVAGQPEAETETETPTGPEQPTNTGGATTPSAPDPGAVTDRLERSLKRERLWSTVSFEGNRVDVRSGSCGDPKMASILDATAPSLKAAGLTRLRCLEQSGSVVSDRDL